MTKKPPLAWFRVENFKAIRETPRVKFGWINCLIGNNGSGKSSLIEAMETFRHIVLDGLDPAMHRWRGFEHVWNKSRERSLRIAKNGRCYLSHELMFDFEWKWSGKNFRGGQSITQGEGGNSVFIATEHLIYKRENRIEHWSRSFNEVEGAGFFGKGPPSDSFGTRPIEDGVSMLKPLAWDWLPYWQFLTLNPESMGQPTPQNLASGRVQLAKDGSNIAEYLNEIRTLSLPAFEGLIQALMYVLPYIVDLQPELASQIQREFFLKMKEANFEVPGWLLSTGTLRVLAILACLRHPNPPPLLVIEEIENGLDPRTLNLLVEEFRAAAEAGTTQVIFTTHSPYLLDLLDLSHIIVVEREDGEPKFKRPDLEKLQQWSKSFSPGRLYTMGRLTGEST